MTEDVEITYFLTNDEVARMVRDYAQCNGSNPVPDDAEVSISPQVDGWEVTIAFSEEHGPSRSYVCQVPINLPAKRQC